MSTLAFFPRPYGLTTSGQRSACWPWAVGCAQCAPVAVINTQTPNQQIPQ